MSRTFECSGCGASTVVEGRLTKDMRVECEECGLELWPEPTPPKDPTKAAIGRATLADMKKRIRDSVKGNKMVKPKR